jgi:uncharacterized protein (TIGR02145 family)
MYLIAHCGDKLYEYLKISHMNTYTLTFKPEIIKNTNRFLRTSKWMKHAQGRMLIIIAWMGIMSALHCQNVSISPLGNNPDNSAALDIRDYTDKGVLIPRLTTAQRNAIPSPATSLLIYNTTTGCFEFWDGSSWISLHPCAGGCIPLSVGPAAGAHTSTQTSITWVWGAVSTATAYYVNTTNNFATATNVGITTSYTQSGLSCGQNYTLYVWAQNACGTSAASTFTFSTSSCVPNAPACGTQVFMAVNMNVGMMINDLDDQDNNSQFEKYCYNNTPANCTTYGGLYQWAEAVGEPYSSNFSLIGGSWQTCDPCGSGGRQGICPSGYHIPTDLEWSRYERCVENNIAPAGSTSLPTFQTGTGWRGTNNITIGPGAKLKASASNSPAWDGTNASGFTALPAGYRINGGGFSPLGSYGYFLSAMESSASSFWFRYLDTGNWQSYRESLGGKRTGVSVRCLQN